MTDTNRKNFSSLSSLKLPYPVLSDHRDLPSILHLLQTETQITSKKIADISKQIDECERQLTSHLFNETQKKISKTECIKYKQQLDALKKHERRVSLQIDFITTKTEIQGLEEERKSNQNEQIKILLRKLNQKLDKMKIYMRTRNEQMKKLQSNKNGKHSDSNKRLKSTTPVIRLTSRITSENSNKYPMQSLLPMNSISKSNNKRSFDDDDELNFDVDIEELFNDHLYSDQTVQNFQSLFTSSLDR